MAPQSANLHHAECSAQPRQGRDHPQKTTLHDWRLPSAKFSLRVCAGRQRVARSRGPGWLRLQPAAGTRAGGCGLCHRASTPERQRRCSKEGAKRHLKDFLSSEGACSLRSIRLNISHTLILETMVVDGSCC